MARYLAYKMAVYMGLGAFLLTWALGLSAGVSGPVLLVRALVSATVLGVLVGGLGRAVLGMMDGQVGGAGEVKPSVQMQVSAALGGDGGNGDGNGNGNGNGKGKRPAAHEVLAEELLPNEGSLPPGSR